MEQYQFIAIVVGGAVVGVAYFYLPVLWDYIRVLALARYMHFDLIRLMQLEETGGIPALAYPLSKKLSEHGVLLAWKTQRALEGLHGDNALPAQDMANLVQSLVAYRDTVGLLGERAGVMAWTPGDAFNGARTPKTREVVRGILRDWKEFLHFALFLRSFLARRIIVPAKPRADP